MSAGASPEEQLQEIRAEIDAVDREIQALLNRRARCAQRVAEVKRAELQDAGTGTTAPVSF